LIARTVGFADVLITGERVALNLLQRLSGIATMTDQFVKAVEGTSAQIVDGRATTPGLRLLERYAVELGGGKNSRFGLDDGVVITANHLSIIGDVAAAVREAKQKLGYLHKVTVQVSNESELRDAVGASADLLLLEDLSSKEVSDLVKVAREFPQKVAVECSGTINLENVKEFAEAGADLIRIDALTNSAPAKSISFKLQPF
jgi:nicotinate-nucleotide pyrophosphorylase (carboxylating)